MRRGGHPALRLPRAAALGGQTLAGLAGDQFVEDRLLWLRAQDAPETLDILAGSRRAAGDDRYVGVGHVNALVEDAPGHQLRVAPLAKPGQDGATLPRLGAIGDRRHQQPAADLVHQCVVLGEDQHPVVAVLRQQ